MNLACSGGTDHFNYFACRGAAYQRVIDNHNPFTLYDIANGIEFQLDAEMPDRLLRLDKGTANVMVPNQAKFEGDAGLFRITDRRRNA